MAHGTRLSALCVVLATASTYAQTFTNPTGSASPTPIDTRQPSLALHMVLQTQGTFGIGVPIRMFAYSDTTMANLAFGGNWMITDGRLLPIALYQGLFSQLGVTYGGNGSTNFAIPDTRGRALMGESPEFPRGTVSGSNTVALTATNIASHTHNAVASPTGSTYFGNGYGTGTPFAGLQPALAVNPVVMTAGTFPSHDGPFAVMAVSPTNSYLSQMQFLTGALVAPHTNSRAAAQGSLLPIQQNTALFALMWNTYGGNGTTTYGLPDMRGRLSLACGQGTELEFYSIGEMFGADSIVLNEPYLPPHTHTVTGRPTTSIAGWGVPFSNAQPSVTVNYFIATYGIYPSSNGMSDQAGYVGEVIAMALGTDTFVPSGYLPCDGSVLPIDEYDTLFSLIGATYGGDGITTFALPDLRGRVPTGTHLASQFPPIPVGTRTGAETTTLVAANLPAHVHAMPCAADYGRAGGVAGQDSHYDNNDFIAFITLFFNNSPLVDIGGAGGLPGRDGHLDNNDFIEFINRFFAPC